MHFDQNSLHKTLLPVFMLYINDATVSSVAETLLIASKDISPHFAIISSYALLFRYDGANI